MRIVFTRFPLESAFGGAEVQTIALMKGLREHGHAVSFLGSCPVLLDLCREYKIDNEELIIGDPPVTKWGAISFAWRQFGMRKKLKSQISNLKPDSIFMVSLSEKLLLTNTNAKVVWIEHDRVGRWLQKNPWLPRLKMLSSGVTTVVVSNLSKEIYDKMGWRNVIAIPNGVHPPKGDRYLPTHLPTKGTSPRPLRIGCIARLTKDKGVDLLIEAVSTIDNVQLDILGRGRGEEQIKDLIHQLTSKLVRLTPFVENIDVFYSTIDILVLPSRDHDPFGIVAAEAMMRGIPVVVTDACGIASHLKPNVDALVVQANSSGALQDAIEKLQNANLRKQLSQAGKRRAKQEFTLTKMIERYDHLL